MPCTIRPYLWSMATPVHFPAPIFLGHTLGMHAFTFLLCVLALCMMYVYIYLLAPFNVIVTVRVT